MNRMRELLEAPDAAASAVHAWLKAEAAGVLRCAAAIAESGRIPSRAFTSAAALEIQGLERLAPALVREELERMLMGPHADHALQWLHDVGVLARFLPEVEATVDFSQEAGRRHKDVWEHTKQVVRQSEARIPVRWAALLHDIGKVRTRTFTPDGGVNFHGHAEVGARMFEAIARRLAFDRQLRQHVRFLILHHLRANQYASSWTDSAVRRFGREMGDMLGDLLDLSRADITSRRPGRREELLDRIDVLARRVVDIQELDARVPPLPTGLGTAITERFGIPPSKRIGDLKHALEEACDRGELEERRDADYYCDWIARQGLA